MYVVRSVNWLGLSNVYTFGSPYKPSRPKWMVLGSVAIYIFLLAAVPVITAFSLSSKVGNIVTQSSLTPGYKPPAISEKVSLPAAVQQAAEVQIPDPKLRDLLITWAAKHPRNQWSIVVKGLGDNKHEASINQNLAYTSASIYKLLLTYTLFQRQSVSNLDHISLNVAGQPTKLSDCVVAMLKVSDNLCGEAVGNYVGWGRANSNLKKLGLSSTNINNPGGPTTTAADAAKFLGELDNGSAFNEQSRQYILNVLKQQTWRQGIPAGCAGCTVADKTGDLNFVRHDAGIVEYPGGKYILSVFTNGASYGQIAELTRQIQDYMSKTSAP